MILSKHFKSIGLLMMLSCAVFSQDRRLNKAAADFKHYAFIDARKMYLNVVKNGYASAEVYKKLGDSYYFNAELEEASKWYEKLTAEYAGEADADVIFRYIQCLKSTERYDELDKVMEKFSAVVGNDRREVLFGDTKDFLEFIKTQSGKFEIEKLPVNSRQSDYAPSYDPKGRLVFASSRRISIIKKNIHQWNEMPFSDLFVLEKSAEGDSLYQLRKLKGEINTRFHESSAAFGKDGKTVYFTRNNYMPGKVGRNTEGITLLKLYRATLNGDKWENTEELPFNSDEYSVAHPALSPDGKKLYFASDMPGSRGMSDLYVVTLHEDGTFGSPQNLGDRINTEGRETFPYISDSGYLYFASDGHTGLGGLDIFMALPGEDGSFQKAYNLGTPINSTQDDFSLIFDEHTKTGYFSSNRSEGPGNDDIYGFTQTGDFMPWMKDDHGLFEATFTTAAAFEQQNQFPMQLGKKEELNPGADLAELLGGSIDFGMAAENHDLFDGTFVIAAAFEQQNQFPMQLNKRKTFKAGADLAKLMGITIYFNSARAEIRPDAEVELQKIIKILKEYPELKLDIRSHTDSRASAAYNMDLSERRVRNTITYLVEKGGIDRSRITGRGYGETQLLNECKDGVKCSDEKHRLNRRSEFIIVE